MINRFTIPAWVGPHQFDYANWQSIASEDKEILKKGLSRFRVNNPIASIVIPVWNEEANILRTLSSFAAMRIPFPTELIFVDNNSTDSTAQILNELGVRVVSERKQGIAHARLAGLKSSRGSYQLCGDGDSLYPPNWIETMLRPLMDDENITCVYGNYSFLPYRGTRRWVLGLYELLAEALFEFRRIKREFLNVRGANFAFRVRQGLAVKGFEMPVTRMFANDEGSVTYVVFGEDGRMGRKLGELGALRLIHSSEARIWTSSRRLLKDGSLFNAFIKRIRKEWYRIFEYLFGSRKVKNTTDQFETLYQS